MEKCVKCCLLLYLLLFTPCNDNCCYLLHVMKIPKRIIISYRGAVEKCVQDRLL